jgi:UDP-N-acetylglucosamine--N-acetylmuramyl-(pentapeptide) pyrophosphoryl-undecaprenol N-acetylglucosamine transferase
MRIILSGGGTAGHINPAISIANLMSERHPDSEILFIGAAGGMENRLVPSAGYPILPIRVSGLRRTLAISNFRAALQFFSAPRAAGKIIDRFSPDLVVGTGGYVCYPVLHAAAKRKIPTAVHESNAVPGLSVRMLSREIDRVLIAFLSAKKALKHPERARVVGNPVRAEFRSVTRREARRALGLLQEDIYILSFGGSLGAATINSAVLGVMQHLSKTDLRVRFLHASGMANAEAVMRQYRALFPIAHPRFCVKAYIEDMALHMRAADLVIARSGAMTVSELATVGCPSILIPYPNATGDHQTANAKALSDAGAAILIPDSDLTLDRLLREILALVTDRTGLSKMRRAASALANTDTDEAIYTALISLLKQS